MTNLAEKTEITKQVRNEKRAYLCQITAQAREIKNEKMTFAKSVNELNYWACKPLNFFITNYIYQNATSTLIFKTFREWKTEGATIKKGSKAYVIWGQPLKKQKQTEDDTTPEDIANGDFYPLCYVFSNDQIHYNTQTKAEDPKTDQIIESKPPIIDIDNYI